MDPPLLSLLIYLLQCSRSLEPSGPSHSRRSKSQAGARGVIGCEATNYSTDVHSECELN